MIKTIGLVLLLATGQIVYGQSGFNYINDFKKILTRTKDINDSLSYSKLLQRFTVNDKILTDFEVLALLIGFTAKPEFKPYTDISTERKIFDLNDDGKYKKALDSANLFLSTHPLSVKVLFEKSYAFYKLNVDSADFYSWQENRIFKAMEFSGDGRSPETPMFALGPADGQDYIRKYIGGKIGGATIGFMGSGREKGNFLDILGVVPRNGSASYKLYFIIQHATAKMFSEEELKMFEKKLQ